MEILELVSEDTGIKKKKNRQKKQTKQTKTWQIEQYSEGIRSYRAKQNGRNRF